MIYQSLEQVIADPLFPRADLQLRAGKHIGSDYDAALFDFLTAAKPHLDSFYGRYEVSLLTREEAYFYLVPDRLAIPPPLGQRRLSAMDMLVGQALALMRLDPKWLENNLCIPEKSVLTLLEQLLGEEGLLRFIPRPRRRGKDVDQDEEPANADAPVVWQYGPLVQAGWATEKEFTPDARRAETFLIATEGSSDVYILRHAFALLRPSIADFFRFIDVSESHPFAGTGNLVKFAEGLAKIDVQNQIVFVFDNDAEGLDAYQRLSALNLPINMGVMMLPELDEFQAFPAQGPEGLHCSDINRRAAAIECYLDLNAGAHPPPCVLWTTFKKNLGVYQGSLENKETYGKEFLKQTADTLAANEYDTRKIVSVLELLVAECTAIAARRWEPSEADLRNLY